MTEKHTCPGTTAATHININTVITDVFLFIILFGNILSFGALWILKITYIQKSSINYNVIIWKIRQQAAFKV